MWFSVSVSVRFSVCFLFYLKSSSCAGIYFGSLCIVWMWWSTQLYLIMIICNNINYIPVWWIFNFNFTYSIWFLIQNQNTSLLIIYYNIRFIWFLLFFIVLISRIDFIVMFHLTSSLSSKIIGPSPKNFYRKFRIIISIYVY